MEKCVKALEAENVFPRRYFHPLTSELSCMKHFDKNATPVAKELSENVLCLPLYADLGPADASFIGGIVRDCFLKNG